MEKNIIVVDEQGNQYGATYPKRAKGLVKNGRARFINAYTICLACPPDTETEDKFMSENTVTTATAAAPKYTVEYVLDQIEKIANDTAYLLRAIEESGNPIGGGSNGETKPIGLSQMVESREKTNQKLIAFYEEIYRDLKPTVGFGKERVATEMLKTLDDPARSPEDKNRAKSILQEYMLR